MPSSEAAQGTSCRGLKAEHHKAWLPGNCDYWPWDTHEACFSFPPNNSQNFFYSEPYGLKVFENRPVD